MTPDFFLNDQGGFVFTLLLGRLALTILYMVIAVIAAWLIPPLVQRSVLAWAEMRYGGQMSERRHNTIARLMLYLTRAVIFSTAAVAVLSLFVDSAGLFTFLGLFTAAMGFSLRQTIGDYISGFIFLFEDLFAIGDEVEVSGERGIVEDVSMRTTLLRAPTGEVRIVPNGDIRTVYNYTREEFSLVTVQVNVAPSRFAAAFDVLEVLAQELPDQIPELQGAPQVVVEDGNLADGVTITMRATASVGSEDEVRRRMIVAVQQTLAENDVEIVE